MSHQPKNTEENLGGTKIMNPGFVNRRRYVRVYYPMDCPEKYKPEIFVQYRGYQVLDICEKGVRFLIPEMSFFYDTKISGVILFPDNSIVEISGEVVRYGRNQIALKLTKGIPRSRISSEIERLRTLEVFGAFSYTRKQVN